MLMNGEGWLLEKKVIEKFHFNMEYRKIANWGQGELSFDNHFPIILSVPRLRFDERRNKCYIIWQKQERIAR